MISRNEWSHMGRYIYLYIWYSLIQSLFLLCMRTALKTRHGNKAIMRDINGLCSIAVGGALYGFKWGFTAPGVTLYRYFVRMHHILYRSTMKTWLSTTHSKIREVFALPVSISPSSMENPIDGRKSNLSASMVPTGNKIFIAGNRGRIKIARLII